MDIHTAESLSTPHSPYEVPEKSGSARLFVGGIPKHVKEPHLRAYFVRFGCIKASRINRSGTDKSRGYAYVEFTEPAAMHRVFSFPADQHVIEGCLVRLEPAFDPIARKSLLESLGERRLYLSGIPATVTTCDITQSISRFGSLQNITKLRKSHPFTTPPSFYCYVTMDRRSDAEELILRQTLLIGIGQQYVIKIRHFQPHSQRLLNKVLHRENVLEATDCSANQTGQDEGYFPKFDGNNPGYSQIGLPKYSKTMQNHTQWVQGYVQDLRDKPNHSEILASIGSNVLRLKGRSPCSTQVVFNHSLEPTLKIRQSLSISQIPNILESQHQSVNLRFNVSKHPR